ncbi:unnamed protein product [Lymnaea stagnalis]|uniref:AIG1-type G domain-containing protein n=1 Tax=Lymnaea stagnalis TaxID=6523 RepID=A0AAV2IGY8_LYMST
MRRRTFLVVGRQGQGKSSVGNSILQYKYFTTKTTRREVTESKPNVDVAENEGVVLVDTTGIGDTGSDMTGDVQSVIASAREAVVRCDTGFDALLLVLKYGVRFTKQEKDAVQMVKSIFGENVFRDWGILVFSYGDNFDLDTEDDEITFEDWCREQTGHIKTLFEEVGYRCVLFDNSSKYTAKQDKEREKLLKIITLSQQPYSEKDFNTASAGREKLIVEEKLPSLKKETEAVLRYTDQRRENLLRNDQGLGQDDLIKQVEVVLQQATQHYDRLLDEDRGTNVLRELLNQVRLRTIGLRSRIDQLRIFIPDRGQRRNDGGPSVAVFSSVMGFLLNSCKIPFDYCLKPAFNFIYDTIGRCFHNLHNAPFQHSRLQESYPV